MFDSTVGPEHLCCVHVGEDAAEATATVTYVLDPDGPVKHSLRPIMMRLCARCAGSVHGLLHALALVRALEQNKVPRG